jgi:hypothetical protein
VFRRQLEEWARSLTSKLDVAVAVTFAEQSGLQERPIGHRKCWEVNIPAGLTDLEQRIDVVPCGPIRASWADRFVSNNNPGI